MLIALGFANRIAAPLAALLKMRVNSLGAASRAGASGSRHLRAHVRFGRRRRRPVAPFARLRAPTTALAPQPNPARRADLPPEFRFKIKLVIVGRFAQDKSPAAARLHFRAVHGPMVYAPPPDDAELSRTEPDL